MTKRLRMLARALVGVRRERTYYLPWIVRPGLECTLLLSNVEARFKEGFTRGPFPATVIQYDERGRTVGRYDVSLRDPTDAVEVDLGDTPGCGFAAVVSDRINSDLYVTLSDGASYTATHGRHEFVEHYPPWTAVVLAATTALLALVGRTLPAFARDQYVYVGPDSRSHVLVMNLSNVTNHVRVVLDGPDGATRRMLLRLPPRGTHLLDVARLADPASVTTAWRLRLEGNAWFNVYLVGAGARDLDGPLSLMHVK
jgi:hypothetical protein